MQSGIQSYRLCLQSLTVGHREFWYFKIVSATICKERISRTRTSLARPHVLVVLVLPQTNILDLPWFKLCVKRGWQVSPIIKKSLIDLYDPPDDVLQPKSGVIAWNKPVYLWVVVKNKREQIEPFYSGAFGSRLSSVVQSFALTVWSADGSCCMLHWPQANITKFRLWRYPFPMQLTIAYLDIRWHIRPKQTFHRNTIHKKDAENTKARCTHYIKEDALSAKTTVAS